jgi:hypothetical protein
MFVFSKRKSVQFSPHSILLYAIPSSLLCLCFNYSMHISSCLLVLALLHVPCSAFLTSKVVRHHQHQTILKVASHDSESRMDYYYNIERRRLSLERLWRKQHEEEYQGTSLKALKYEIKLLTSLQHSDDAIDELTRLWRTCPTPESMSVLKDSSSYKDNYQEEEYELRRTIEQHPLWAEPHIRLAWILSFTGRILESYKVALQAIELKPWHWGLAQLFLVMALRRGDKKQALHWARLRLPPLNQPSRRKAWVEITLTHAKQLEEKQASTLTRCAAVSDDPDDVEIWQ